MIGNDLIRIEGIKEISKDRLCSLLFLYREILSNDAVIFYLELLSIKHFDYKRISTLLSVFDLNIIKFEKLLHNLEIFNLIKTYNKDNEYIIEMMAPLAINDFFNNVIYDRLLANRVGDGYKNLKEIFKDENTDKRGYKDISAKLDIDWSKENEDRYQDLNKLTKESIFPIEHFMKNVSYNLFPKGLRTYENISYIAKLADSFGVSEDAMRRYILNSMVYEPIPFLDKKKLKEYCLKNRPLDNGGDGYNMPSLLFLKKAQKGVEPTYNDRLMIYKLSNDKEYHLNTDVVNVLLEYALKECDNELKPSFVYTVASNWHRNKIDTVQKAKAMISDRKRTFKKREDIIPEYDSSLNPEITEEDLKKYL